MTVQSVASKPGHSHLVFLQCPWEEAPHRVVSCGFRVMPMESSTSGTFQCACCCEFGRCSRLVSFCRILSGYLSKNFKITSFFFGALLLPCTCENLPFHALFFPLQAKVTRASWTFASVILFLLFSDSRASLSPSPCCTFGSSKTWCPLKFSWKVSCSTLGLSGSATVHSGPLDVMLLSKMQMDAEQHPGTTVGITFTVALLGNRIGGHNLGVTFGDSFWPTL